MKKTYSADGKFVGLELRPAPTTEPRRRSSFSKLINEGKRAGYIGTRVVDTGNQGLDVNRLYRKVRYYTKISHER